MQDPHDSPPQFAPSRRGYDRQQVDDYTAALRGFLAEAEDRAIAAERRLAATRDVTTPEEVVASARENARRMIAEAEREAAQLRETAQAEVAAARDQVVALRQQADQEQARRDFTVARVRELREVLGRLPVEDQVFPAADALEEHNADDPLGERRRVIQLPH